MCRELLQTYSLSSSVIFNNSVFYQNIQFGPPYHFSWTHSMKSFKIHWLSSSPCHSEKCVWGRRQGCLKPCLTKCVIIQELTHTMCASASICHANSLLVARRKWGPHCNIENNKVCVTCMCVWNVHVYMCVPSFKVSVVKCPFGCLSPHYPSTQTAKLIISVL